MFQWPGAADSGAVSSTDSAADTPTPTRVGFVYPGPVGDHSWTLSHEDARQALDTAFDGLETHYEPSVQAADAEAVMEAFIDGGDDLIVAASPALLGATLAVAANHPGVRFLTTGGTTTAPNLGTISGRIYQPWYLAGIVAASKTCTRRLGFVAPVSAPDVIRPLNAFALGAREVDPTIQVEVTWTGRWLDTEAEPTAAAGLIDRGADVVTGLTHSTLPIEATRGRTVSCAGSDTPVWSIGAHHEASCDFAPETCLTAPYWNWGPLLSEVVAAMHDGTWQAEEPVWQAMQAVPADSVVHLAPLSDQVDSSTRLDVESRIPELQDERGRHLPFVGPLIDTSGTTRIASGAAATDEDLRRMCWLVDGIIEVDPTDGTDQPAVAPPGCDGDG